MPNLRPTSDRSFARSFSTLIILGSLLVASASAQSVNPSSPTKSPTPVPGAANLAGEVLQLETFNVSGSLIAGASTFTSPTPVLVVASNRFASSPACVV